MLKRIVDKRKETPKINLCRILQEEMHGLSEDYIIKLYDSILRHLSMIKIVNTDCEFVMEMCVKINFIKCCLICYLIHNHFCITFS